MAGARASAGTSRAGACGQTRHDGLSARHGGAGGASVRRLGAEWRGLGRSTRKYRASDVRSEEAKAELRVIIFWISCAKALIRQRGMRGPVYQEVPAGQGSRLSVSGPFRS